MKRSTIAMFLFFLSWIFFHAGMVRAEPSMASPVLPHDIYMEGTYYGKQGITFSLSVTRDNFVKIYSNGIVILGEKDKGEAVYYFINKNKKLITKVSQGNLYRIGEFGNWNSIVGLINLKPGTQLVKEKLFDDKKACMPYEVRGEEKIRVCMNDTYYVPIYIEQDGSVIERTTRLEPFGSSLDTADLLANYLREKYRYIDADDDIAPDAD